VTLRWLRPSIWLFGLFAASLAHAQGADATIATDLFNAGRDLMAAGNYEAACPKLAESARLDAKVGTLGKSAECEEHLGHMAAARARWQQAVNVARVQNDPRLARCETEFARIDKLVPKLSFMLQGAPAPGMTLTLDEVQLSVASVGVPVAVEAGKHTITANAPGRATWTTTIEVRATGGVTTVSVPELAAKPEAAPAPAAPSPAPASPVEAAKPAPADAAPAPVENAPAPTNAEPHRGAPLKTVGLVTAGIGVVGLAMSGVFASQAKSKFDHSNERGGCVGNACTPAGAAARNDARSTGDVAIAGHDPSGAAQHWCR